MEKMTNEQRLDLVNKINEQRKTGEPLDAILKKMNINKSNYYTWKSRFKPKKADSTLIVHNAETKERKPYTKKVKPTSNGLVLITGNASEVAEFYRQIRGLQ